MLPPLVAVYEVGPAKSIRHAEWTEQAERHASLDLADAARAQGWLVPADEWTDVERAQLREFHRLAYAAASRASTELALGGAQAKLHKFDSRLGPSLSPLADRYGTDEAVGVVAVQAEQSYGTAGLQAALIGSMFAGPVIAAPAVTGVFLLGYEVDLRTGQMRWYEFDRAPELVGVNTGDLRKPESARRLYRNFIAKLDELLAEPSPVRSPRLAHGKPRWETATDRTFRVRLPAQWHSTLDKKGITASRDGNVLNEFSVHLEPHMSAFRRTHRATRSRSTPGELAEWYVAELLADDLPELEIVESSSGATLAGQPAARVRFVHRPWGDASLREEIVLLTATRAGLLSARLSAPNLAYFGRALGDFEAMAGSVTPGLGL